MDFGAVAPGPKDVASYLDWSRTHRSNFLLYALAIAIGFVGWMAGSIPAMFVMSDDPAKNALEFQYTFLLPALLILLIVRVLLGRPGWTVALPSLRPRWRDYLIGVGLNWLIMGVLLVGLILFLPGFELTYRGFDALASVGFVMIPITIGGFMIQTGFEELYFRGLIMQSLRKLTGFIPLIVFIQAYLFAQLHLANLSVAGAAWVKLIPYTAAGIYFGWTAWRTGSLLMPMGLHAANNLWGVFFVSTRGDTVQQRMPAIFLGPATSMTTFIVYAIVQAVLVIAAVEFIVRRQALQTGTS